MLVSGCQEIEEPWTALRWARDLVEIAEKDAQRREQRVVAFIVERGKFFDRLREVLRPRHEKVRLRLFEVGPDGFVGGLSAGNCISMSKTSIAMATQDLYGLFEIGALTKVGEKRYNR